MMKLIQHFLLFIVGRSGELSNFFIEDIKAFEAIIY
jgi:hypothetical protein